jgi:L-alanine-DL-glutamate epimerase-like enolase superfamily enzyme
VTLRDGYLELPDKPGVGLALNDETVKERTETGFQPL